MEEIDGDIVNFSRSLFLAAVNSYIASWLGIFYRISPGLVPL